MVFETNWLIIYVQGHYDVQLTNNSLFCLHVNDRGSESRTHHCMSGQSGNMTRPASGPRGPQYNDAMIH